METTTTQDKTRREWVDICKITQPEIGKAWEEELNRNPNAKWGSISPNMGTSLDRCCGFWWVHSIKGESYWAKIHKDMEANPSKYETLPQGEISQSMGVNTKPAHKLNYKGYWIDIDPNMPSEMVEQLKECVNTDIQALRNRIKADEVHINNLINQRDNLKTLVNEVIRGNLKLKQDLYNLNELYIKQVERAMKYATNEELEELKKECERILRKGETNQ